MAAVSAAGAVGGGPPGPVQSGPTWDRLEDQIEWYGRKASAAQKLYKRTKLGQLVITAAIPVAALLGASKWVPGVIGAIVVVLEGAQQLYRHHEHWITYRSTCEALKRERYLYLAGAGAYASAANPLTLLAENVEALLSQEQQKWALNQASQAKPAPPGKGAG